VIYWTPPDGRRGIHGIKEGLMSVYKVIDVIGTSSDSWEDAAAEALRTVRQTIRDVRIAEVVKQDIHLEDDGEITYRSKLQISFKYESDR
jgi:dodecin